MAWVHSSPLRSTCNFPLFSIDEWPGYIPLHSGFYMQLPLFSMNGLSTFLSIQVFTCNFPLFSMNGLGTFLSIHSAFYTLFSMNGLSTFLSIQVFTWFLMNGLGTFISIQRFTCSSDRSFWTGTTEGVSGKKGISAKCRYCHFEVASSNY